MVFERFFHMGEVIRRHTVYLVNGLLSLSADLGKVRGYLPCTVADNRPADGLNVLCKPFERGTRQLEGEHRYDLSGLG